MKIELTQLQRQAVELPDKLVTVHAVAGSGKTRVLLARYMWMLDHDVVPSSVAIITFTRRAARVLSDRIAELGLPHPAFVGTLHSLAYRILIRWMNPDLVVFEEKEPTPTDGWGRDWLRYGDEVINRAMEVILENRDAQEGIRHFLWDEAQDTSLLDVDFVVDSFEPETIFAVGDENQEIYGFAGRKSRLFLHMMQEGAASIRLVMDFRNDETIASLAQELIHQPIEAVSEKTGLIWIGGGSIQDTISVIHSTHPDWSIGILTPTRKQAMKISKEYNIPYKHSKPPRWAQIMYAWAQVRKLITLPPANPCLTIIAQHYLNLIDGQDEVYRATMTDDVYRVASIVHQVLHIPAEDTQLPAGIDTPDGFINWYIDREWTDSTLDEDNGKIIVTTMHASKGEEWDAVILPDLKGPTWIINDVERAKVWYVAITRARHEVGFIRGAEMDPVLKYVLGKRIEEVNND